MRQRYIVLALLAAYFVTRLCNLTIIPIFNDESTYIRYGLHHITEDRYTFASLLIGKEPMMPYLYAVFGKLAGSYLVGARLATVLFGTLTLVGLYLTSKRLVNKNAALIASVFYVVCPFTLFYDRLAIMDSTVSAVAIWVLYFTHSLINKPNWKKALLLGLCIGTGLWIKSSALFYVFLPVLALFVYVYQKRPAKKKIAARAKAIGISLLLAVLLFAPLYAHPFYEVHKQLMKQYTYPLSNVFSFPVNIWFENSANIAKWLFFSLTPTLFVASLVGAVLYTKKKKDITTLLWFAAPLGYEVVFGKLFSDRHILLATIPLFVYLGFAVDELLRYKKTLGYALLALVIIPCIYYNYFFLTKPLGIPSYMPQAAYTSGFASGYGVEEAINYLKEKASNQPIVVVLRNDHGNPEDAVVAYLNYEKNITVQPLNDPLNQIESVFQLVPENIPVYFVSRGGYYAGIEKYFKDEVTFEKPNNDPEYVGVQLLHRLEGKISAPPQLN